MKHRRDLVTQWFPDLPAYRLRQIDAALFCDSYASWGDVTTLPQTLRGVLSERLPWMTIDQIQIYESKAGDTYKAVVKGVDDKKFETVLMQNRSGQWSICVSSQVGCAMGCTFCATGAMGWKRNLLADEIVDQYRFWKQFLKRKKFEEKRISNVVFMGMGEPMANYAHVKAAIHTWLAHTDLGPTKITVSSVGVLPQLRRLLDDPEWPPVKIAISLHIADQKKREEIVPTTAPGFLEKLAAWSHDYHRKLGNRNHHITYEYTLITGVNDTPEFAHELGRYMKRTAFSKVNVIPYNPVRGKDYKRSDTDRREQFKNIVRSYGTHVTERKTMGEDIDAACGQLATTIV